jgi:hypothetical protein
LLFSDESRSAEFYSAQQALSEVEVALSLGKIVAGEVRHLKVLILTSALVPLDDEKEAGAVAAVLEESKVCNDLR